MKALQHIAHGDIGVALRLVDTPEPTPGDDEIVVALEAVPIHASDVMALSDRKRAPVASLPRIGGTEGVGRVVAVGAGVTDFKIGDRVFPPKYGGLFQERVACKAAVCFHAPDDGPAERLCIVQTMGLTAFLVLADFAALPSGSWIIHDGANSSIGRMVTGLAHERELRIVSIVRRAGVEADLKALGSDVVIVDPGDADALASLVNAATGDAPIPVALDVVGGSVAGRIAHCLGQAGTLVLYGGSSGAAAEIEFIDLVRRNISVCMMSMSRSFNKRSAAEKARVMTTLGHRAKAGLLAPQIAGRYALADYAAAFAHAAQPSTTRQGKVIFTFGN